MEDPKTPSGEESGKTKSKWLAWLVVFGSVWALAEPFDKSLADGLIILIIAIGAAFFYYKLKGKIKLKHDGLRALVSYVILLAISAFLIGFCTSVANTLNGTVDKTAIISGATRDYFVSQMASQCASNIPQSSGFSTDQISSYCSCVGNGTANITTMQDADSYKSGSASSAAYKARIVQIATQCKNSI